MRYRGEIIGESGQPLFAAARYLLKAGKATSADRIETYRGETLCLAGQVGKAAKLTVKETSDHAAYFARFVELDRSVFLKMAA